MPLVQFKRVLKRVKEPIVSIRDGRFHFNVYFARVAELSGKRGVLYSVDDDLREIGFEFIADADDNEDAYTLEYRGRLSSFRCTALDLIAKKPWVRSVAFLASNEVKSFTARKSGKVWVVRLMPSFEMVVERQDSGLIPDDARGIYRYRDAKGEVVFIGKGVIRSRLSEPLRKSWEFRWIDYSTITSEEDQFTWEAFWIDRFKETNNGRLPYYNRHAGHSA